MEIFPPQFFSALMLIILLDLVLAGDNAVLIGLAARNVPVEMQKRVILWGTAGAIVVRACLTLGVVWLLKIPGFSLIGGLLLIWIAWKLTQDQYSRRHHDARGRRCSDGRPTYWLSVVQRKAICYWSRWAY